MRRRQFLFLSLCLSAGSSLAWAQVASPLKPDSLRFAVIGDSGSGTQEQYQTGKVLADARDTFPYSFVLMLGDNIYGGQKPKDLFLKFEQPYRRILDAGVSFYASLGNHDDPDVDTAYKPFNMNGNRYYTFTKDAVQFFALDSSYMHPAQARWFEDQLQASKTPWKIAYMHHPIYSSGKKHGSDMELRAYLEPLLLKYGVDVVMAGHEHFYERLAPQKGVNYFIAGSAGKLREGNIDPGLLHEAGFDKDLSFMLVEIAGDDMHFQVLSRLGSTVDKGTIVRRGASQ